MMVRHGRQTQKVQADDKMDARMEYTASAPLFNLMSGSV